MANGNPSPHAQQNPQQRPPNDLGAGTFDMGGGQQLRVKINGKTPENYLKDKASSMIWGWIIGGFIMLLIVLGLLALGIYIFASVKSSPSASSPSAATIGAWDGKSTFECGGNDVVTLTGVTAKVSGTAIKAGGNCQLSLTGVSLTADVGIEAGANAKVKMTGGSITATTSSVVAGGGAHVDCVGTTVSGKPKVSAGAKVACGN